jgi:DNA-3-methyladenine glycosylase I
MPNRCAWTGSNPLMIEYHDNEWGVPQHDDGVLFEYIILDGAQAGLSWLTILRKREGYRHAFDGFEVRRIAQYDDAKIAQLLRDPAIVRNRLKVNSAVTNAQAFIAIQQEFGSFDTYLWNFVGNRTGKNAWPADTEIPAKTVEAEALSKDLTRRGFKFVGPTICYAFIQAAGMVNDHVVDCFRYNQV